MPDTSPSLAERRARLQVALGALRLDPPDPTLAAKLNTWKGLGAVIDGMTAQGFDIEIQQYPHGWWAKFYLTGASHPLCAGSGWGAEPWRAVQEAAWVTLTGGDPEARLRAQLATPRPRHPRDTRGGPAGQSTRARP